MDEEDDRVGDVWFRSSGTSSKPESIPAVEGYPWEGDQAEPDGGGDGGGGEGDEPRAPLGQFSNPAPGPRSQMQGSHGGHAFAVMGEEFETQAVAVPPLCAYPALLNIIVCG